MAHHVISFKWDELVGSVLRYLCGNTLEENLEDLQREIQKLMAMRDDLLSWVSREEKKSQQRLTEVKRWFAKVDEIEREANLLLDTSNLMIERFSTYGYCSVIFASTYKYNKKVDKTLEQVKTLMLERTFELVPERAPRMKEMPALQPSVYQVKLLMDTYGRLMEYNVRILGIYGMGGVGKTLLLSNISNKVSEFDRHVFDLVIFVNVGLKDQIQDKIGERLGLEWQRETEEEKAAIIFRILAKKKFILLLDNIWGKVNLEEIGVPYPSRENGCKIVFTTRSLEVCRRMRVDDEIQVQCLPPDEAWDLFKEVVGETTLTSHPDIPALARIVVEKCCGLPLALKVFGESMAGKRTIQEWRHAIHVLISSTHEFPLIEDEILPVLKYSYDTLSDEKVKSCFLYCALYPEDADINREDLVNYWVGEGLVRDEIHGYWVITVLVRASLLLEVESGYGVRMHDVIRDMAFWVASDYGRQKELFVVEDGERIQEMPKVDDWSIVKRMSVQSTKIESILDSPNCSDLRVLFLQNNSNLKSISGDFFRWMASLVVMDLSHNRKLSELPEEVSYLVSLRLLNLSGTSIKDLPNGLRVLTQLIHLNLEFTSNLRSISLVSGLLKLRVLKFYASGAALDLSLLKNLELLNGLELLTITVRKVDVLEAFLGSELAGRTQGIYLEGIEVPVASFAVTFGALSSLRNLEMMNCDIKESETDWQGKMIDQFFESTVPIQITPSKTLFKNLSTVVLDSCIDLKDVTWLTYAAQLEVLTIASSPRMKEVISREKAGDVEVEPFQQLQVLDLDFMKELESIYWRPLSFPNLQKVHIKDCTKLHKLPLNSTSVQRIDDLIIEVDDKWLEFAEWESSGAQERFRPALRKASLSQLLPG